MNEEDILTVVLTDDSLLFRVWDYYHVNAVNQSVSIKCDDFSIDNIIGIIREQYENRFHDDITVPIYIILRNTVKNNEIQSPDGDGHIIIKGGLMPYSVNICNQDDLLALASWEMVGMSINNQADKILWSKHSRLMQVSMYDDDAGISMVNDGTIIQGLSLDHDNTILSQLSAIKPSSDTDYNYYAWLTSKLINAIESMYSPDVISIVPCMTDARLNDSLTKQFKETNKFLLFGSLDMYKGVNDWSAVGSCILEQKQTFGPVPIFIRNQPEDDGIVEMRFQ